MLPRQTLIKVIWVEKIGEIILRKTRTGCSSIYWLMHRAAFVDYTRRNVFMSYMGRSLSWHEA